ncbi:DNA-directed RNA polymerase subunit beta [Candidatus Termititenax persephonae]|uniref:DNA-directed RNA polymerase subunit beta n=1 Tax=Candidatus Termititenax persephonae TaxID=2218525 RepID=A0A388TFN0_9BACT|nr:DNA-directed RNA polymerase subunit beta [Candidatus Termititenax persephonae]
MAVKIAPRVKLNKNIPDEVLDVPKLTELQLTSFQKFLREGIAQELKFVSPIKGFSNRYELYFSEKVKLDDPKYKPEECLKREITYSLSLTVPVKLVDTETGEVKKQDIYMGEIPCMTEQGTFIYNGDERVVISQFMRSSGVYFKEKEDLKKNKKSYLATIIPNRGAWLEFEADTAGVLYVYVNKMKKIPLSLFLSALGYTEEEMYKVIASKEALDKTIEKGGPVLGQKEALIEIHRRLRPGDHITEDGASAYLTNLFFNPERYDLSYIGRYKMNQKLGLKVDSATQYLTKEDVIGVVNYIIKLTKDEGTIDDIDHLANRRVRAVGELMQKQFKVGLARLERLIKEQMMLKGNEDFMPQGLINIRPLIAVMNEFFGSSQLSQFMDQTNPLAELANKRRLSAMGPGGLTKERAGFEVRDIHPSHYGRICPIETPEGPNSGLISPLATFSRVNEFGFIETPYRKVEAGRVTNKVEYLSANGEDDLKIAPYDFSVTADGRLKGERVPVRYKKKFVMANPEEVNYIGVSPRQIFGISSCLVPFLEHDDANRALMGSNMMRQATPLLNPDRALVGTGMEKHIGRNSSTALFPKEAGEVIEVDAQHIVIKNNSGKKDVYTLTKYQRTNQNTCRNQKPIVSVGQKVTASTPLVEGTCYKDGELAVGKNTLIAFMPFEGYNFEDAILVSERMVKDDVFTSIHITRYEVDVRATKQGDEELTPELPNVSEEALRNLDERGIVRIGSTVISGDILVGKVTPKGEQEQPAEEKLLRAIFGDKARDMKDNSLRVTSGEGGKVVDVRIFSSENNDDLPAGVHMIVRVYVAQLRKVMVGDKMAGRHGNKGVISRIMPAEDMPFLPDGTPVDIVLNPLGVPSRMNVGQVYETVLGNAAYALGEYIEAQQFDEAYEPEASVTQIREKMQAAQKIPGFEWLTENGKVALRDGRTGELYDQPVMCGYMYMLKLIHLVEEKMHARATGPYSLVTQQPLGGKAQFGGQRFGEMEVWALEAYGAAYTLQELLTVKSDDVSGRARVYEAIIKGKNLPKPGTPESFRVLVREMRSLGLDMKVITADGIEIDKR